MSTQVQKAQTLTPLLKNKEGLPDVPSPFIMVCAYFGYLIKLYYARIFSHPMLLNIFYNKLKNGRDAFCLCINFVTWMWNRTQGKSEAEMPSKLYPIEPTPRLCSLLQKIFF